MKVSKKKYLEAINYLKQINAVALDELDLSDFPLNKSVSTEDREDFRFMGLLNQDFINLYLLQKPQKEFVNVRETSK